MENTEHAALDTGLLSSAREGLELFGSLLPKFEPFHVGGQLIRKLLATSLNRKIFLRMRYLWLARISVLGNQVASESRKVIIRY